MRSIDGVSTGVDDVAPLTERTPDSTRLAVAGFCQSSPWTNPSVRCRRGLCGVERRHDEFQFASSVKKVHPPVVNPE